VLLIYLAAIINGFGASILWLAEGKYIANCATDSNKGLFNGTFWAIFMSANIVGYLMSAFVLGKVNNLSVFFAIMTLLCICASLFFLLLNKPAPHPESKPSIESKAEPSIAQSVAETWKMLKSKRMVPLLPVYLTCGYSVALFGSLFIPYMTFHMEGLGYTDKHEERLALLAMVAFGVGEISGSLLFGRIMDKTSVRTTSFCIIAAFIVAMSCVISFNMFEYFNMWHATIMTFSWGIYDSGNSTFVMSINGFQFESKTTPF